MLHVAYLISQAANVVEPTAVLAMLQVIAAPALVRALAAAAVAAALRAMQLMSA